VKSPPILSARHLHISFKQQNDWRQVVHDVNFELFPNEVLAIVGESGSGKSVSTLAILGLLPKKKARISGSITFEGLELNHLDQASFRKIRGRQISMIFQEPMSSLNPSMHCGNQVIEVLMQHTAISYKQARSQTLSLFEKVKLPRPESMMRSYPHQLSGGQKQRVMIAMAIACKPKVLIADEPTTALDVTVQKEIIDLLKTLQQETGMSIIFISHDLSLVGDIADRVMVMYQGQVVETASAKAIFDQPQHQYTKALLHARPSLEVRLKKLPTIDDYLKERTHTAIISPQQRQEAHEKIYNRHPLLEVRDLSKTYISNTGWFGKREEVNAVNEVSFKIYEGETLGLVGESGCGKSTLGNAILQLEPATSGAIFYKGKDITTLKGKQLRALRKEIQIIFQDPFASLNPRLTVGQAVMEPMTVHKLYAHKKERISRTIALLKSVGLTEDHFHRYPHEFSGGQRQRIGIARTIALQPKLIVCDESVSALDISVQAQVLNLLNTLKETYGFTYIFISHDLAVVKYMADQLIVMQAGKIEEMGEADQVYKKPQRPYTQRLINAIPKGR
jgi:peptide/nickel transport system ATP-binding protein